MGRRVAVALVLGVVGVAAANAADFAGGRSVGDGAYQSFGARIEPVIIWDSEPGVIVRSYWYAPWENRHYFPKTGRRPKVGRREHIPPHRVSKNEDYYRFWSVSSVFAPVQGAYRRIRRPRVAVTPIAAAIRQLKRRRAT